MKRQALLQRSKVQSKKPNVFMDAFDEKYGYLLMSET
jgi:hypothetical protein